jgi:hypothetical protein
MTTSPQRPEEGRRNPRYRQGLDGAITAQAQPLSKLTRALAAAQRHVELYVTNLDRSFAKLIYSAIPNKPICLRTIYAPRGTLTEAPDEELEALHLLSVGTSGRSNATFLMRTCHAQHAEFVIIDETRLLSCLGQFRNVSTSEDASLISVSTDANQIARISQLFESSWVDARELSEATLLDIYRSGQRRAHGPYNDTASLGSPLLTCSPTFIQSEPESRVE